MKLSFMLTDDADYMDKILVRVWGFTILGVYYQTYEFALTILGVTFYWEY